MEMVFNFDVSLQTFSDEFAMKVFGPRVPPQPTHSVRYIENRNRNCGRLIIIVTILIIVKIAVGYFWSRKTAI